MRVVLEITTVRVNSGLPAGQKVALWQRRREHIMSENWDHLGGKEVRDGQTTQFSANLESVRAQLIVVR